jgi:hypothetical protein
MAVNGDVVIQCKTGYTYQNNQFGCSTASVDPFGYFFYHTELVANLVSSQYTAYSIYLSPLVGVIAVFVMAAGYRFLKITLSIYAFIWEFFFALFLLIQAQATNQLALYFSLGLSAFVALLCMWRGPVFGRTIVGLSSGSTFAISIVVLLRQPVGYLSVFGVVIVDVIAIILAFVKKRTSIVFLFIVSVFAMALVCVATFSHKTRDEVVANPSAMAVTILPAVVCGVVTGVVNVLWVRWNAKQRRLHKQFMVVSGAGTGDSRRREQKRGRIIISADELALLSSPSSANAARAGRPSPQVAGGHPIDSENRTPPLPYSQIE